MRKQRRFDTDRAFDFLLWLLLLGSALAIGAVHPPMVVGAAAIVLLFSGLAIFRYGLQIRSRALALLVVGLLGGGLWALVQTLPTGGVVAVVSPQTDKLWSIAEATSRISANLLATRAMAVKCLAGAILLVGSVVVFRRPDRVTQMIEIIIVTAAIISAVAFAQSALHLDRLLWLYEPQMGPVREGLRGPFVNPDHFGAYIAVGSLLSLSRGITLPVSRRRFVYFGAAIPLIAALLLSLSLSAWIGFAGGLVGLGVLWWHKHRQLADVLSVAVPIMAVAAFLTLLAIYFGLLEEPIQTILAQFAELEQRVAIWMGSLGVFAGSPLVGVGSGSLTDLLAPHLDTPAMSVWYARNQVIQVLVDFGLLVGGLLLVGVVTTVFVSLRNWARAELTTVAPPIVGVLTLVTISAFDFAIEIPALGLMGILLLGALLSQTSGLRSRSGRREKVDSSAGGQRRGWRRIAIVGTVLLTVLASTWTIATHLRLSRAVEALEAVRVDVDWSEDTGQQSEQAGRDILEIRPGWARVYTLVGMVSLQRSEPDEALRWLRAAAELLPTDVTTLRLLGIAHLRRGERDEAIRRLRQALDVAPSMASAVVDVITRESHDMADWLDVASDDALRGELINSLLSTGRAVDALRFSEALLEDDEHNRAALEGAGRAALELDLDALAETYAQTLLSHHPSSSRGEALLATVDRRRGDLDSALSRLESAIQSHEDDPVLLFALGDVLLARAEAGDVESDLADLMRMTRDRLRPVALSQPHSRAEFHALSAKFYLATGEWRAAASAARNGLQDDPSTPRFYLLLGFALFGLGEFEDAEQALLRAAYLGSTDERIRGTLEAIMTDDPTDPVSPIPPTPDPVERQIDDADRERETDE